MSIKYETSSKNSSDDDEDQKDDLKTTFLTVHLTLITKLIRKINGEYPCICHNISKEQAENIIKADNNDNSLYIEEEIINNFEAPITNDNKIFVKDIINNLQNLGYPTMGSLFSIYIKNANDFVFLGADPLDQNFFVEKDNIDFNNFRIKMVTYIEDKLIKKTEKQLLEKLDAAKKEKDKRTKERKIEFIIEKVNAWRRLYNGFYNDKGQYIRYSLDQAAKMVGISKKSLDDYLLQLRLGRKFGFNFNQNKTKKVGVLRAFVKNHKNSKVDNTSTYTNKDNTHDKDDDDDYDEDED